MTMSGGVGQGGEAPRSDDMRDIRLRFSSKREPDVLAVVGAMRTLFGVEVEDPHGVAPVPAESAEDLRGPFIGYDQFYKAVQELKPGFNRSEVEGSAMRAQIGLYTAANEPSDNYSILISAIIGFQPEERERASSIRVNAHRLLEYVKYVHEQVGARPSPHAFAQAINRRKLMPRNTGPEILKIWELAAEKAIEAENQQQ